MNKSEFAKELGARAGLTGVQAQKVTDEFLALLTEAIAKGERVAFLGFGSFSTSQRAARVGVNPRNPSQKVKIPARKAVRFTPGAPLKAAANSGKVAKRKAATTAKKATTTAKKAPGTVKKDVKKVTTAVKKDVKKVTTAVKKDVKKVTATAKKVVRKPAAKKK